MTDFKQFEAEAWERKAGLYNDTWGSVTAQVNDTVLAAARLKAGELFLDIGCGPGHLCGKAAARGARVIGSDYSIEMLVVAKANYPALTFQQEDAEKLSFNDDTFDVVTMNYLLLHVADQPKALAESCRILKPGGRLVFTVWLPPSESPGLNLILGTMKEFADMTVIPPASDIFLFASPTQATEYLSSQHMQNIQTQQFDSFWEAASGEDLFRAVQAGSRMGGLLELQQPAVKDRIFNAIRERIEKFRAGNRYIIPTPSLVVSAEKSST